MSPSRRATLLLSLFALLACSEPVRRADPGDLTSDLVFPVAADAQHHVVRVHPPFALHAGANGSGSSDGARFEAAPGEVLFLVALERPMLRKVRCDFDSDRLESAQLTIGAPPPATNVLGLEAHSPIPAEARVLRVEHDSSGARLVPATANETAMLREQLTLRLSIGNGRSDIKLNPYGERANLLDSRVDLTGSFERVRRIDERHVLAMTNYAVMIVERGGALDPDCAIKSCAGRSLFVHDVPGRFEDKRFRGIAAGAPGPDGAIPIVVVGEDDNNEARGFILDLRMSAAGALELAGTATLTPVGFRDVAIDSNGLMIAVGRAAWVYRRRLGSNDFEVSRLQDFALSYGDLERVTTTGLPAQPHVIAGRYKLHRFDAALNMWHLDDPPLAGLAHVKVDGLAAIAESGDVEYWAVGDKTIYRRKAGMRVVDERPVYPGVLAPCLLPALDPPTFDTIKDVALDADAATLVVECNTIVRVRRADLCVSSIAIRDNERIDPQLDPEAEAIEERDGRILVGGGLGMLLEADLR